MIAYKVVRRNKATGKLQSAVINLPGWTITYPPQKWVYPRIGLILAFSSCRRADTFKEAETFGNDKQLEIWSCEVSQPRQLDTLVAIPHGCRYISKNFERFWASGKTRMLIAAPSYTIGARAIKLLEKIS